MWWRRVVRVVCHPAVWLVLLMLLALLCSAGIALLMAWGAGDLRP